MIHVSSHEAQVHDGGLTEFCRAASDLLKEDPESFLEMAEAQLGHSLALSRAHQAGISGLNHDGAPLQVCLVFHPKGRDVRILSDPCSHEGVPEVRIRRSRRLLATHTKDQGLLGRLEGLLDAFLPPPTDGHRNFSHGAFWWGRSVSGSGSGIYVDVTPLAEEDADRRLDRWICGNLSNPALAQETCARLNASAWLSSAAVMGRSSEQWRAKLYFRLRGVPARGVIAEAIPLLRDERILQALGVLLGGNCIRQDSLLVSVGFSPSGALRDAKVDLAAADLPPDLSNRVRDAAKVMGVQVPETRILSSDAWRFSFVGLGMDRDAQPRLNLYMKPREGAWV